MKYSAIVYDKLTGNTTFIKNQEYTRKADFIRDLRGNGYRVNPKKVKKAELFDYIMEHTNCNYYDWDLRAIPAEGNDVDRAMEMLDNYFETGDSSEFENDTEPYEPVTSGGYTVESFEYLPNWTCIRSYHDFNSYEKAKAYEDRASRHAAELRNKGMLKDYRYVIRRVRV